MADAGDFGQPHALEHLAHPARYRGRENVAAPSVVAHFEVVVEGAFRIVIPVRVACAGGDAARESLS